MGKETGQLVGSLVTASLTGGKMAASLAQNPPDIDGAIDALTTGIEGAFTYAAGTQGDSNEDKARADQLKAISKTVKGAIQAAAKARKLPDRIKNKDVAGLVDDMTAVAKSGLECATSFKVAEEKKAKRDELGEGASEDEVKAAMAKITQKALQNPTNRRVGLEAQKMNPTLAKYAMAWAAVENNDPLAKAAVRQCGLTDATLRNPETNVKNVQKYFEVYFNEDTQVRGIIEIQADWLPSKIELSLKSWSTVQSRAIKQGNLVKISTGKIDRLLAEMVGQESKVDVAEDALDQDDLSTYLASLDQLESELESYKSMVRNAKTQGAHKEVQGVVEMMLEELSEKRSNANSRVKAAA